MNKFLIIDGHNLLFQMFYGMPSRIVDSGGKPIQGVIGFIGALLKIIKMTEPTHTVVLFDGEHGNFRSEINSEYKKNRIDYSKVKDNDNPFSQLKLVYKSLEILGIAYFEEREYEVDDIIATYALRYGDKNEIIISSFDSDYFQLINDNIKVLRYRGVKSVICDRVYIFDRLGILPKDYADFKALTGDSADNIRGAENIGKVTAAKLINEFGSVEQIISNSARIAIERIRNSILNNEQRLIENLKLIRLKDIGKIPFELDELAYKHNGLKTYDVLEKLGLIIK